MATRQADIEAQVHAGARPDLDEKVSGGQNIRAVYVYEAPVRIWHWINALAIVVLCVTGYFIGAPLPTMSGEASDHYLMGYIRFAHFAAGYIFAVGLIGRLYWALVGNHHARELFWIPFWRKKYWLSFFRMLKWYAFLLPQPDRFVGHNPLARLMMFLLFFLGSLFMVASGFALYGEGAGAGSWQSEWFGGLIASMGGSQAVHSLHRLGMWLMIIFTVLHVYAALREDIMGRQSIVSTMISGFRTFKD